MRTRLMHISLQITLTFILAQSGNAQDACTADFGTHIGSPACPYQWVGATTVLYDGSGNGLGFIGMTSQCRADYGAGARMCTSQEILDSDTVNVAAISSPGCWVQPSFRPTGDSFLDASGLGSGLSSVNSTCRGWSEGTNGSTGLVLNGVNALGPGVLGGFITQPCGILFSVACCKPTPVPAPSLSMSLPIGVGALAALASMKGGG